jgi:hypothetical protein
MPLKFHLVKTMIGKSCGGFRAAGWPRSLQAGRIEVEERVLERWIRKGAARLVGGEPG